MTAPEDIIELERLEPRYREAVERFVSAQESNAVWKTEGNVRSLQLPDGTFLASQGENDPSFIESWWSKIGAVLFVAGLTIATEAKWSEMRSLMGPALVGTIVLFASGGAFLYRGYFVERRRRRHLRYRRGLYLLNDALVERAGDRGDLCRVFPIARLRRFELRKQLTGSGGGRTLYVGYEPEGVGGIVWVPVVGGDFVSPLEAWLARPR